MKQLSRPIFLVKSQSRNDCGPCSVASVLSFFTPDPMPLEAVSEELRPWRIPLVGATLPWGVSRALRRLGMETAGGFLGTLDDVKRNIDLDRPVVVLVRPTDLAHLPFYALHYRVAIGYNDRATPEDGELYFNCSAAPNSPSSLHPGNVAVDYKLFRRQWLTYCSINWYVAAYPGKG